ncbi:MAG TPA: 30S ribosomal protein S9 [Planctomycetota bacterium]
MSDKESTPAPAPAAEAAPVLRLGENAELEGFGEEAEVVVKVDPTGRFVAPPTNLYHWGTGRRKTAVARVRVRPGSGQVVINGKPIEQFFPRVVDQGSVLGPLKSLDVLKKVDVVAKASGGGITGQAGAVRLGIGRALELMYPDAHDTLRDNGHLTRDPRMVERKKYGLAGARRSFQWVKR